MERAKRRKAETATASPAADTARPATRITFLRSVLSGMLPNIRRAAACSQGQRYNPRAMHNLWRDEEARGLSGVELLVYRSHLIGRDPGLVVWGGGNTSIKHLEDDYRGRSVRVMRVKGSGSDLKTIKPEQFPGIRLDDL